MSISIRAEDTALDFVKPRKGTYRVVSIPDGIEARVSLLPAERSCKLTRAPQSDGKPKKVWEYVFEGKSSCRLNYEGSTAYSFRWWDNESFTLDTENGPIFFERVG